MAENYEDGLEAVRLLNENPAPPPPVPGEPPPDDCVCHGSRGAGMYVCEHCTYGAAPSAPPQELEEAFDSPFVSEEDPWQEVWDSVAILASQVDDETYQRG